VGPVPSESVVMWLAFARTVLAQVMVDPMAYGHPLPNDALAAFEAYLDEWELIAERDVVFRWSADVDAHKVKELADTWLHLGEGMAAATEKRGYALQPVESLAFNDALLVGVLTALGDEGLG